MIEIPPLLEAAIAAERESLRVPRPRQVAALKELFELFTKERSRLGRESYLDQPRWRAAYLGYHLPMNVARATYALMQAIERAADVAAISTIVDLGGGPGSASWGTLAAMQPVWSSTHQTEPVQVRVYDQSSGALKLGERLWRACREELPFVRMAFFRQALPSLPEWEGPALVWLAMVLNELMRSRRFDLPRFIDSLTQRCPPGSLLLLIEPALRKPGRDLLAFHDLAIACGEWEVVAPCTHQNECPLLKLRDRSWCHFRFHWNAPRSVLELARPLGLECRTPSVAYLALKRRAPQECGASAPHLARVIGDPMPIQTGGQGIYVCRAGERELLSPVPAGIRRGDLVRVDSPIRGRPPRRRKS